MEEALQIREQMIANVSHELRTPLTSILGITDILLNQSLNQKDRDLLETIKQSGTTLLDTVSDMLCFSNIEQNRVNLLTKDVGLEEFMRHCVESIRWMARSKKLELSLTIAGDAPANIRTDRTLMEHLVRSLLNNAIKFTDDGFVRVHVSSVIRKNDLDWYEISISDSGPGITKSRLARIFEPFAQGDSSFAREHGGLGLGLALARRIAEVLGGTLEVDSITHRGTTVTVALPACADEGATEQVRTHPHEDRPSKILIVEDNTVNAKILQMQLRMLGHDSDMASNGLQALRAVSTGCYGLLLMDVQMPIMDGLEATRQIRSSAAEWASIPIIAVTAHAADADRKRCLEAGMDDYITKPVDKNLLKSALARWLPQSQPPTKDSTSPAGFDTDFAPPPDEHTSPPREREDGNGIDQTPR